MERESSFQVYVALKTHLSLKGTNIFFHVQAFFFSMFHEISCYLLNACSFLEFLQNHFFSNSLRVFYFHLELANSCIRDVSLSDI